MKCYTKMTRNHDIAPAGTGPRNPEQVASAEVAGSVLTSSDEHLRFERLISDLSARFVNITPDQVGREIENALKQIVEFFQVDRCGLLGTRPDKRFAYVMHAWYGKGAARVAGDINLADLFPHNYDKLFVQGLPVITTKLENMPPEADTDRQTYAAMGVRSSLDIPLFFRDHIAHVIVIQSLREELSWPEIYIPRLRLLGEIFVIALERRRADQALRESEERLSLAADSAGAMLWGLNIDSGHLWTTEKAKEFFGFAPGSEMDLESFLNVVHPEDREKLRRTIGETMRSGRDNSAEYRIARPDKSIRWVLSRGRPYPASPGEPARLMGVSIDVTERKMAEEALRESETALRYSQKNLQMLAGRLISAQEEELRRLSRELHDDLTQRLAVLAIEASKLELELNKAPQSLSGPSQKISQMTYSPG